MREIRVLVLVLGISLSGCAEKIDQGLPFTDLQIKGAESLAGLEFTSGERDLMREDLADQRGYFQTLHRAEIPNSLIPALRFDPELLGKDPVVPGTGDLAAPNMQPRWSAPPAVSRPSDLNDLAFAGLNELSELIRTRQVTCRELTELALGRLQQYDPSLECLITLLAESARQRADQLDDLLDQGVYLGPLHGIPYGAKDLLAVPGHPTTWGAAPYRGQIIADTATVVAKLEKAGAVLVAKLTLGALAWGDVWFGGMTRNPWNLEQGSSGSSAGSASAVSAGLVPFAIGTETWGSIVSPCTRCGVTGLRPTFGRVSRAGAMALSWSMDKIGPIARSVEDCAMVFDAIRGSDGRDPTVVNRPFPYRSNLDLAGIRIGYLSAEFSEEYPGQTLDQAVLEVLRNLGVELIPIALPTQRLGLDVETLSFILSVEAAAAFEELTLSGRDDQLTQQIRWAWPNVFRCAQLIPAVQYLQANRVRTELMGLMAELMATVDVYVTPSLIGDSLLITNLTGHPQVVVPAGFIRENEPHSVSFVGRLFDEATVLAVAQAYQDASGWHRQHPPGF